MMGLEDNVTLITEFLEKADCRVLVIAANQQGQFTPSHAFPTSTKTKVHFCLVFLLYIFRLYQCMQFILQLLCCILSIVTYNYSTCSCGKAMY